MIPQGEHLRFENNFIIDPPAGDDTVDDLKYQIENAIQHAENLTQMNPKISWSS